MNILKTVKTLRIILFSFLVLELFFAFVIWVVIASGSMHITFDKMQKGIFLLILLIISIMSYYRANAIFNKLIIKIRSYADRNKQIREYRNATIIKMLILHIIPFMFFFISMFTGFYLLLVLGIILLFTFFKILYPNTDKILKNLNINKD
ncbi:MAG: hypothetical protein L3J74_09095 [Bacteroidales bacterium]|nr:hypothetical protein [Bacteroidales bacterium]